MNLFIKLFSLLAVAFLVLFVSFGFSRHPVRADSSYAVHQGDTLWGIANTCHISVPALKNENRLTSDVIYVHQKLHVPSGARLSTGVQPSAAETSYVAFQTVQRGDTLWQLSVENHISVSRLTQMNHLHSTMLHPGQKLRVFVGKKTDWQKLQTKKYRKSGIPMDLIPVYQSAGRKYGVPWTVLAAIHHQETRFSTGKIMSYAGAQGPMQFMPATFRYYGVCAPGHHGVPDINNVYDAIYSCAHMLKSVGYAKNPTRAIYAYNHSMHYVEVVQRTASNFAV